MNVIKKIYSPGLVSGVHFVYLSGPTKIASSYNAQFTDVKFEAALSKSFRHFHLSGFKHKQLLILAVGSWAISVIICLLQFLHRLRRLRLHLYCFSLTSRRSNCRSFRICHSTVLCLVTWS